MISSREPSAFVHTDWRLFPFQPDRAAQEASGSETLTEGRSEYRFVHETRRGPLVLTVQAASHGTPPPPDWIEREFHKLALLLDLAPNWDSYGAPEVDALVGERALNLLLNELPTGIQEPLVNPTAAGGVQLEWHRWGANAEVELMPGGEVVVYLEQAGDESEAAGELQETRPLLVRVGQLFTSAD